MTTTLCDDGSDLTIPPDHLYQAALDLTAWFVDTHDAAALNELLARYAMMQPFRAAKGDDDQFTIAAILAHYSWETVFPWGAVISWSNDGVLTDQLELPLTAIATHLSGSWKVSGPDGDRFGGRYQLGVGKVANLEGQVIWSEGEPAEFTTADWHPVVLYQEGPEG